MTSICVNPNCRRPLAAFSEGRLFQFEIISISVSADDENKRDFDELPYRDKAHFWLCGRCSGQMRLTLEPWKGLQLIPLEQVMGQRIDPMAEPLTLSKHHENNRVVSLLETQSLHHSMSSTAP